jgi:hypothetical protein
MRATLWNASLDFRSTATADLAGKSGSPLRAALDCAAHPLFLYSILDTSPGQAKT